MRPRSFKGRPLVGRRPRLVSGVTDDPSDRGHPDGLAGSPKMETAAPTASPKRFATTTRTRLHASALFENARRVPLDTRSVMLSSDVHSTRHQLLRAGVVAARGHCQLSLVGKR